ncbi:unnamed protein product, partial [Polarella glacialis]
QLHTPTSTHENASLVADRLVTAAVLWSLAHQSSWPAMCRSLSSLGLCLVLVSFSAAQRPPPPPVAGVPTKPPAWVAPTSNASSAGGRRGARRAQEVKEVYPYQIARIPPPPAKFVPGSGSVIAYVYTMFE